MLVLDLDLSNQSRGSGRIVLERGDKLLLGLVVANKTMDFRLDENEAELGVFILAIDFKMLPYGNRLLDEVPKVLRDGWAKSACLEDTENFVVGDEAHLWDTVRISESNTNLRGSQTLAGKLSDLLDDIISSSLEPRRRSAAVREGGGRNALPGSMHTTHVCGGWGG